jgi:hypothetical protein
MATCNASSLLTANPFTRLDPGLLDAIKLQLLCDISANGGGGSGSGGSTSYWISSAAMVPRVTNGPGVNSSETATNDSNYDTLDFDAATSEGANFTWAIPNNWDLGTVTARFVFTNDSGSGTVTWKLCGRCVADGEAIDSAFGTAQSVTKTVTGTSNWNITAATPAITIGGTPSVSAPIQWLVERDIADTLAVDARLIGLFINWTAA